VHEVGQGEVEDSIDETKVVVEVAEEKEAEEVAAVVVVVGLEEKDGRYRRSIECKIRTGVIRKKPTLT
jgi:hypothetical protein